MLLPKNSKYCGSKKINIFHINLNETDYCRAELFDKFNVFNEFCKRFRISPLMLVDICDILAITDNSLFDYQYYQMGPQYCAIVEENAILQIKYDKYGRITKNSFNLYISASQFVSLALNKVAQYILKKRFGCLYMPPFVKAEKRFKDNILEMPSSLNTKISDIDTFIIHDNALTIDDIIKLYTINGYAESNVEKSIVSIYENGDIFVTLNHSNPGNSLFLKIEDLYNKDWEAVEKRYVFSVKLETEGKWFEGEQKDAPYFSNPLVELIKKELFEK